ncbi:MAG: M55 family metallopeptidase [Caldiserica bacterium]|nr:M55 family metallopeptidase [Caldisericota bacterium]
MKYFISLDMEGVAGLASWSETSQEQRELMTGETCAAIEGIRSVDSKAAIVIADSHSRGQNLLLDRLPQDAQVVRGYPRPLYMVEGADETCDAALFVGYHAPVGTLNGSMDHTYSSSAIYEVLANGHVVGETELNMVLLARLGIPFIFGSGDEQYCRFSQQFFPHAVFVTTKWATGRYSQRTLMPEASKTLIRDGAADATRRLMTQGRTNLADEQLQGTIQHEVLATSPSTWTVRFLTTSACDVATWIPGTRRSGGRELSYTSDEPTELYRFLMSCTVAGRYDRNL